MKLDLEKNADGHASALLVAPNPGTTKLKADATGQRFARGICMLTHVLQFSGDWCYSIGSVSLQGTADVSGSNHVAARISNRFSFWGKENVTEMEFRTAQAFDARVATEQSAWSKPKSPGIHHFDYSVNAKSSGRGKAAIELNHPRRIPLRWKPCQ